MKQPKIQGPMSKFCKRSTHRWQGPKARRRARGTQAPRPGPCPPRPPSAQFKLYCGSTAETKWGELCKRKKFEEVSAPSLVLYRKGH